MAWTSMGAEKWNERYPVGTPVLYFPIEGEKEHRKSKTRSVAWRLGNGESVVQIEGTAGGVALSHLLVEGDSDG